QGNARLMASSSTYFNFNEYNKDLYETQASFSLINPVVKYDDLYEVNKNIWVDEKYIKILKRENVNHRNLVINNKSKLIKIEYNKDLYETQASFSLINPVVKYDDLYEVNKNIWVDEKYIKILKRENVNHRNLVINNKSKLIKIEYNQLIEDFIIKYENKVLDYKQLYRVIERFTSFSGEEVDEYIELM